MDKNYTAARETGKKKNVLNIKKKKIEEKMLYVGWYTNFTMCEDIHTTKTQLKSNLT